MADSETVWLDGRPDENSAVFIETQKVPDDNSSATTLDLPPNEDDSAIFIETQKIPEDDSSATTLDLAPEEDDLSIMMFLVEGSQVDEGAVRIAPGGGGVPRQEDSKDNAVVLEK